MNKFLHVSETFYSLQGEGQTMGIPSVFLRLAGCNLLCNNPGEGFVCDTIEVWRKGKQVEFRDVLNEYMNQLIAGAHLVITGGEPLLQQNRIVGYLQWFGSQYNTLPTIEIETNGTIVPRPELIDLVTYWNCSPKLSNSGEPVHKRIKEDALNAIRGHGNKPSLKFVIRKREDVNEIIDYMTILDRNFSGNKCPIILMPAGCTQDELAITRPLVAELCKETGLRYCDRLQVTIWNKRTGV